MDVIHMNVGEWIGNRITEVFASDDLALKDHRSRRAMVRAMLIADIDAALDTVLRKAGDAGKIRIQE